MSGKKIILFIVEGITDKTNLGFVLSKILNNNKVEFALTDGDITSRNGVIVSNIAAKVGEIVKEFSGKIFKASDFIEVVHLVDMDGNYIPNNQILEKTAEIPVDPKDPLKSYYDDNYIYANNIEAIQQRNYQKSTVLNRLISLNNVWRTIPYSVYFFSCNIDHVMHDQRNLFQKDKNTYAAQFEKSFSNSPHRFLDFLNSSDFAVPGNYSETWDFIKVDSNSLKRYTNFHLFFLNPKNPRDIT